MSWLCALYIEVTLSVDHEIAAWQLAFSRGVPFAFRGVGVSMLPTLRPGDEAMFAPLVSVPCVGDVLLYRAGDALVAHRLLAHAQDGRLRLRGDYMAADDPLVCADAILGKLVTVRRRGRVLRADRGPLRFYARAWPELHRRAPLAARAIQLCTRVAARLTLLGGQG